jgi:hypothetical protein
MLFFCYDVVAQYKPRMGYSVATVSVNVYDLLSNDEGGPGRTTVSNEAALPYGVHAIVASHSCTTRVEAPVLTHPYSCPGVEAFQAPGLRNSEAFLSNNKNHSSGLSLVHTGLRKQYRGAGNNPPPTIQTFNFYFID